VTIHACDGRTDGRTDGQTEFLSLYRMPITCSAVKMDVKNLGFPPLIREALKLPIFG